MGYYRNETVIDYVHVADLSFEEKRCGGFADTARKGKARFVALAHIGAEYLVISSFKEVETLCSGDDDGTFLAFVHYLLGKFQKPGVEAARKTLVARHDDIKVLFTGVRLEERVGLLVSEGSGNHVHSLYNVIRICSSRVRKASCLAELGAGYKLHGVSDLLR